jgi:hypothetical protein
MRSRAVVALGSGGRRALLKCPQGRAPCFEEDLEELVGHEGTASQTMLIVVQGYFFAASTAVSAASLSAACADAPASTRHWDSGCAEKGSELHSFLLAPERLEAGFEEHLTSS